LGKSKGKEAENMVMKLIVVAPAVFFSVPAASLLVFLKKHVRILRRCDHENRK